MKTVHLLAILAASSLFVMIAVDYWLGARAEFVNAWSVIERLIGRTPSAGDSVVFRKLGTAGELIVVLIINIAIGGILTMLFRPWVEK